MTKEERLKAFQMRLDGESWYYTVNVSDAPLCAILNVGDKVTVTVYEGTGELRSATAVERSK